jgi:hypothetical protein
VSRSRNHTVLEHIVTFMLLPPQTGQNAAAGVAQPGEGGPSRRSDLQVATAGGAAVRCTRQDQARPSQRLARRASRPRSSIWGRGEDRERKGEWEGEGGPFACLRPPSPLLALALGWRQLGLGHEGLLLHAAIPPRSHPPLPLSEQSGSGQLRVAPRPHGNGGRTCSSADVRVG